jgi:hypothetical protein
MTLHIFTVLLLAVTSKIFSQSNISSIDALVAGIKNKQEMYEKYEKINSQEGFHYVFHKDNEPKFVVVQQHGKIEKNVTWYFKDSALLYTETNWSDSLSKKILFNEKTYHDKTGLIAWINSESTFIDANSAEFKKLNLELTAYGQKLFQEGLK